MGIIKRPFYFQKAVTMHRLLQFVWAVNMNISTSWYVLNPVIRYHACAQIWHKTGVCLPYLFIQYEIHLTECCSFVIPHYCRFSNYLQGSSRFRWNVWYLSTKLRGFTSQ